MIRKKRETYPDLPKRSDPNYMKLYTAKHKDRLRELSKSWLSRKRQKDPNYNRKYDAERAAKYREENRATLKEKQWERRGIKGMTHERYLIEIKNQGGKCKICDRFMRSPQVDHDHETGEFRGLLCIPCNNHLGVYEKRKSDFEEYLNDGSL